ncbi:MAG: NIPSNAP family protein [Dehalococcoidia bacterium]|nr:NIPSNAP family protein [Dehalococcoidia bacterium]MDW8119077.1 NIPSNAP family protein [Chloroflexota bacterium]
MLYELRIYEAMPGKLPALNNRFATITIPMWKKHGIRPVAFWTEDIGTSNQLVYLLAWESLAEREQKWTAFQNDPEWQALRAQTEQDGPLVARIHNRILHPTPYSPMQ